MTDPTVTLLWRRQSVWSQAAGQLKARVSRARTTALTLTITGAVLGTASAELLEAAAVPGRVLAACSCIALALASYVIAGAGPQVVRDWTRARSVSEALKADVYCYLAGAGAYRDGNREAIGQRRLEELTSSAGDLLKHVAGIEPVRRQLPLVNGTDSYAEERVLSQLETYYRPKARKMAERVRWGRRFEVGLGAFAAALGAIVAVFPATAVSAWIGVVTTVATAIAAHVSAARYEHQQIEFTRTADELERLLARRSSANGLDDDAFVQACERVISIENEGWMAKLGIDEDV
ncbi:DUF4231 domain-containing protein [Amycolatopsis sp. NPDC049252]|uniref:DUF4231 domain-containing protein n=1 Tax=Amycolatopsis sp. NPDC049252 TaxID=3363933 RepID=UPI003723DB56